jgi:DNA-binding CsgD family transcriptional regulator
MCLTLLATYLSRILNAAALASFAYALYALATTLCSILLTTALLLMFSRYLINLLPATSVQKHLGNRILTFLILLFLVVSIYLIFAFSGGDWVQALQLTIQYHFFGGSMFLIIHGVLSLFFIKRSETWEEERLLKGICYTFLPLAFLFPLDLIFFLHSPFKLVYLSFSILSVYLYYFISRRYFLTYEQTVLKPSLAKTYGISEREEQIITLMVEGLSNQEIAKQLFISPNTVKTHIKNIYGKLGVNNRLQLFVLLKS